jgi:iron(III) transport system substrate-binding protein
MEISMSYPVRPGTAAISFKVLKLITLFIASTQIATLAMAAEVNVYSYRQPSLMQPLFDKFSASSGITVNSLFAEKGLAERIKAEGVNSPADVILASDIARLSEAVEAGVTQAVDSKVLKAAIPAPLRDPADQWFALTRRARVVYASKERVKVGEVTTYEALADPQWKGRICSRSGASDYNVALLAAQIAHHGEAEATKWLKGLRANLAHKPQGDDRAQIKAVAQGECDIALGNSYYLAVMLADPAQRQAAEAVNILFPNQQGYGAHVNISGMAMAKNAPNRDAAIQLMEFLASKEAQQLYAEINNEYPVGADTPWSPLMQSWGKFKADELPLVEIAGHRVRALEIVYETGFDQ